MVKLPWGVGLEGLPTETGIANNIFLPSVTYTRCFDNETFTLTSLRSVGLPNQILPRFFALRAAPFRWRRSSFRVRTRTQ